LAAIWNISDRRRLGPDVDYRRLVLQSLEAADQLSELLADAHVIERDRLRLLHHAKQFGGQHQFSARL